MKVKLVKTQLLQYHYSPPDQIKSEYNPEWQTEYLQTKGLNRDITTQLYTTAKEN